MGDQRSCIVMSERKEVTYVASPSKKGKTQDEQYLTMIYSVNATHSLQNVSNSCFVIFLMTPQCGRTLSVIILLYLCCHFRQKPRVIWRLYCVQCLEVKCMKSVAIMLTIITCRMDMMTVAGVAPIDRCRLSSHGFDCRRILTKASRHMPIFSRFG